MDMAQPDSQADEARPTDPDLHWTGWALGLLREAVEIDMRAKRMLAQQQAATPAGPETPPDFGLIQSRLSRSVRLSIAMTERIRADYLMRKAEREGSGEQQRRRQRRETAVEAAVTAIAASGEGQDVEHVRAVVWEALVEDEILDLRLDTLSDEAFVREVYRKIGRPPDPAWRPPHGGDEAITVAVAPETAEPASTVGWAPVPDKTAAGQPLPAPSKPDSS
jgi:hypothetical protein